MNHLLTFILFTPLVAALLVFLFGTTTKRAKWIAFAVSLIPLVLSVFALLGFDWTNSQLQFSVLIPWIQDFGISYYLGIDGLSMPLVMLTTLLTTLTTLFSFDVDHKTKTYFTLLMLLETGVLGVFMSLDFFLFYLFWELVLIPMYFLIIEWGGPRRRYAALKFFVYTHVASLIMLVGIIAMYFVAGRELGYYTFNMIEIMQKVHFASSFQYLVFPALFFGFAVKIPVVPFHTWLPDAHVEAPTGGSVLLAGVLLKMGGYGLIRIAFCLMPEAAKYYALPMAILGVISMVYGAFLALAQDDMKKMVAYSSVSHMGSVLLGLAVMNVNGFNGAIYQMFAHGLISAMLFMLCGILQHTFHTRRISELGGLANRLPRLATFFVFTFFASLGLPLLAGFVAELLVFLGAFSVYPALTLVAMISLVITAAYYLWALQRAFFGPYRGFLEVHHPHDLTWYQSVPLTVLGALVLFFGICPAPILNVINVSSQYILQLLGGVL